MAANCRLALFPNRRYTVTSLTWAFLATWEMARSKPWEENSEMAAPRIFSFAPCRFFMREKSVKALCPLVTRKYKNTPSMGGGHYLLT